MLKAEYNVSSIYIIFEIILTSEISFLFKFFCYSQYLLTICINFNTKCSYAFRLIAYYIQTFMSPSRHIKIHWTFGKYFVQYIRGTVSLSFCREIVRPQLKRSVGGTVAIQIVARYRLKDAVYERKRECALSVACSKAAEKAIAIVRFYRFEICNMFFVFRVGVNNEESEIKRVSFRICRHLHSRQLLYEFIRKYFRAIGMRVKLPTRVSFDLIGRYQGKSGIIFRSKKFPNKLVIATQKTSKNPLLIGTIHVRDGRHSFMGV